MATPLIITRTDFDGRIELSANMVDAKINNRILEAQDFDLRGLMGDAMYWDFIASLALEPPTASYQTLLIGGDYAVKEVNYTFYGLKPVLVYYTTARLIKALDIHLTPNGVMQKKNEFSDPVESKDISWRANQYINQGLAYWNMCEKYLDANKTLFPLWKPGCEDNARKPAPRISAVGASEDFNYHLINPYGRR